MRRKGEGNSGGEVSEEGHIGLLFIEAEVHGGGRLSVEWWRESQRLVRVPEKPREIGGRPRLEWAQQDSRY